MNNLFFISKLIFLLGLCFLISLLLVYQFKRYALARDLLDHPNHRSSHKIPTPVGGGIIFVLLWSMCLLVGCLFGYFPKNYLIVFLPGALITAVVGYLDDYFDLPADWRMTLYVAAAACAVMSLGGIPKIQIGTFVLNLGVVGSFLAVLAFTWSINLFNFMDGADGLAGTQTLFIFGTGGFLLWLADAKMLALLAWLLVASVGGFLVWNWPRAKIFMGDTGSVFLGFLVPTFAVAGDKWYNVPTVLWLILYTVFYFDATITLLRRMIAKQRWYQAHRLHAFQRLHQNGWSHLQILVSTGLLNVIFSAMAIVGFYYPTFIPSLLLSSLGLMATYYLIIEFFYPMFSKEVAKTNQLL